jgi:hypothetical protein
MAPLFNNPVGLPPPHRAPSFRIAYGGPAADFPVLGLQSYNNHDLDLFKGANTFFDLKKKAGTIALGKSCLYALLPLRALSFIPTSFSTGGTTFPGGAKIFAPAIKPVPPKILSNQPLFNLWVKVSPVSRG